MTSEMKKKMKQMNELEFDKKYKELKDYIVKKAKLMTNKEFEKFKNHQKNKAIKLGILKNGRKNN